MGRPLRRDDAELRKMSPQRVDCLRALANQQIARVEQHALRLLLPRLHRHEAHRGREAASQIASASAASFFCRFTNGFT